MYKSIVALGDSAIALCTEFENIAEYDCLKITDSNKDLENSFFIRKPEKVEDYEAELNRGLISKLNKLQKNIIFIVSGSDLVSSMSLVILEKLKSKKSNIEVLYIKTELDFLPERNKLHERMVRNVLQEYTRSGLLDKMCLVDTTVVESMCQDLTILNRSQQVNFRIAYCYHSLDQYKNIKPITSSSCEISKICRIFTIGYGPVASQEKKLFFPLKEEREVLYYFAINEDKLASEKNLFRTLTDPIRSKDDNLKTMFLIYETEFQEDYVFFESYTPFVQNDNLKNLLLQN